MLTPQEERLNHIELLLTTWFCKTYKNADEWSANYLDDTKQAKKNIMVEIRSVIAAREAELREKIQKSGQEYSNQTQVDIKEILSELLTSDSTRK